MKYRQITTHPATVLAGEAAVVTPADNRMHVLNDVGTHVWELCDGNGKTLDEIVALLTDTFDVSEPVARTEAQAFLDDAVARGLLAVDED